MPPRINVLLPSYTCARTQRPLSTASSRLAPTRNAIPHASTTTTITTPKGQIPPESPRFVEVPKGLQPQSIHRPWVKGILPVPRKIFRASDRKHKASEEYLSAVTPEPKIRRAESPNSVGGDKAVWKSEQSALRRRNLREGLIELHERKQMVDHSKTRSRARKQAESLRLATAPQREDERLTNPTVHTALLPSRGKGLPDPNRESRLEQMRINVDSMQKKKSEQRRQMLHTLYMNARDFIVRPAQLDAAIDRIFDNPDAFMTDRMRGENVWHLGAPETMEELLHQSGLAPRARSPNLADYRKELMEERLNKIGEELTGGKL
ncbi:hypothetical protein MMC07_005501 [Pseudocyphellaria aurata]|nr:hypothetical protein [Pseudocyphellaria aurata]